MKISVTEKNIKDGQPGGCSNCPIALAFADVGIFGNVTKRITDVCIAVLSQMVDQRNVVTPLPDSCLIFMNKFDNFRRVEPFSFEVII